MPGRSYQPATPYKYGFNGKEKDDEIKGGGNSYDFGDRIYDSRLGKWLSLDPLQAKFPMLSPYTFVANNPIFYIDPDGRDIGVSVTKNKDGSTTVVLTINAKMVNMSSNKTVGMMSSLISAIEADVYQVYKDITHDSPVGKVHFSVSINITEAKSLNDVKANDHVIAIVDDIPVMSEKDADGKPIDPIALAARDGNTMLVEAGQISGNIQKVARKSSHEIGHWLGLEDEYTKKGTDPQNLMHRNTGKNINTDQKKTMINPWSMTGGRFKNNNKDVLNTGKSATQLLVDQLNKSGATYKK